MGLGSDVNLWGKGLYLENLSFWPFHLRPGFLEDLGCPNQTFEGQGVEEWHDDWIP